MVIFGQHHETCSLEDQSMYGTEYWYKLCLYTMDYDINQCSAKDVEQLNRKGPFELTTFQVHLML